MPVLGIRGAARGKHKATRRLRRFPEGRRKSAIAEFNHARVVRVPGRPFAAIAENDEALTKAYLRREHRVQPADVTAFGTTEGCAGSAMPNAQIP